MLLFFFNNPTNPRHRQTGCKNSERLAAIIILTHRHARCSVVVDLSNLETLSDCQQLL